MILTSDYHISATTAVGRGLSRRVVLFSITNSVCPFSLSPATFPCDEDRRKLCLLLFRCLLFVFRPLEQLSCLPSFAGFFPVTPQCPYPYVLHSIMSSSWKSSTRTQSATIDQPPNPTKHDRSMFLLADGKLLVPSRVSLESTGQKRTVIRSTQLSIYATLEYYSCICSV